MNGLILALDGVNQYFLSIAAALLVLAAGAAFTVRFRAFYLLHPFRTLRAMPRGGAGQMLLSLGGTVGVGNISGVAVALTLGGAGAVFWMWVGAVVPMALKYAEIILGMLHRETRGGKTVGGAPYYIRDALGGGAAAFFAVHAFGCPAEPDRRRPSCSVRAFPLSTPADIFRGCRPVFPFCRRI